MERFNLHIIILISLQLVSLTTSRTLDSLHELVSSSSQDIAVYPVINCGQGTYKASNASYLGFDCECNSGWRKLQIGPFIFPFCVLPDCTANSQCDDGSSPPPPLSPTTVVPFLPGPFGFPNSCEAVWCGNGTCVADGAAAFSCQCHEGFENLLNLTFLPCFKPCYFGGDCSGLEIGPSGAPSPPSGAASTSLKFGTLSLSLPATPPGEPHCCLEVTERPMYACRMMRDCCSSLGDLNE